MKRFFSAILMSYLRRFPIEKKKYLLERYFKGLLPEKSVKTIYRNPEGILFYIDNSDFVMNRIFVRGVYERNTIRTIRPLISNLDGVFIDCGANIGLYSLYMAKFAPKAEIHAFEPLSHNRQLFLENLERNGVKNVRINDFGLSDQKKELELFIVDEENYGRTSLFSDGSDSKSETIVLSTLDSYCEENGIEEISFIKVDIEGAEFDFITGAENIIRKSPRLIMLVEINECAYTANHTPEQLFDKIVSLGFNAFIEREYPFGMKQITNNRDYRGNIIFIKK